MMGQPAGIADWRAAYQDGKRRPRDLLLPWLSRLEPRDVAWILRCQAADLAEQLARLDRCQPHELPLYGIPFAVKDNIDVAGLPTTAACPAFARVAERHATVVERLIAAGAVLIGKTNLDQFATGLVGTRSPFGEVPNSFDAAYVSGGSSSGSASVVARGLVAFALGTDTAGSGRVPAGFNNLVGIKPTPGRVPMAGVLPACRTLDVVSVFALTVSDAAEVMAVMEGADGEPSFQSHPLRPAWFGDEHAPLRIGIPRDAGCDAALGYDRAWTAALARAKALGAQLVHVDMAPLAAVARLLYEGPWVAERYAVVQELLETRPEAIDPVVRGVIEKARNFDASSAFRARYELEALRVQAADLWASIDVLMVPTAITCPTRAAVAAEPVLRNSELGRYTNFVNLLGMSALAVPASMSDSGLPFGVTLIAPGGSDAALARLGARWEAANDMQLGCGLRAPRPDDRVLKRLPASAATVPIAVVGAHLRGLPLHESLRSRGSRCVATTTTAAHYRLYALARSEPPRPGLVRVAEGGTAIALEVHEVPASEVGSFLQTIPYPLALGPVELADGRWVIGFVCEAAAVADAEDISRFGGWRNWLASR